MKIIKIAIMVISTCGPLIACDTDRYANQSTVTVAGSEDPELRKALIQKLNALNFDYEVTREGDIRFPRKSQPEFDAILVQVTHEQSAEK